MSNIRDVIPFPRTPKMLNFNKNAFAEKGQTRMVADIECLGKLKYFVNCQHPGF
jgi:hypothetical protein